MNIKNNRFDFPVLFSILFLPLYTLAQDTDGLTTDHFSANQRIRNRLP